MRLAGIILVLTLSLLIQCKPNMTKHSVQIHGHRGCRGMWPENTLKSFEIAVELGLSAIELDVVLTANGDVLVSHDPFMHHEICSHPDGRLVNEEEEKDLNIFRMTTQEAQTYWCGMNPHPRFPEQSLFKSHKPTLGEAVLHVNSLLRSNNRPVGDMLWNIEIKSQPSWDSVYHPGPGVYADLFLLQFNALKIDTHCVIQSFDPRILEKLHQRAPHLRLVLLNEDSKISVEDKLNELTFIPFGYSPNYALITEETVTYCKSRNIELIAWTVNEPDDLVKMRLLGVNHIITDYPERAIHTYWQ
jgi:glycerophosphoryl diester phosphodiesterase